jgi:hypothetical protein
MIFVESPVLPVELVTVIGKLDVEWVVNFCVMKSVCLNWLLLFLFQLKIELHQVRDNIMPTFIGSITVESLPHDEIVQVFPILYDDGIWRSAKSILNLINYHFVNEGGLSFESVMFVDLDLDEAVLRSRLELVLRDVLRKDDVVGVQVLDHLDGV